MPLTEKGSKILSNMKEQYGSEKGESVFYASRNKGTISGVDMASDAIVPKLINTVNRVSQGGPLLSGAGDTKDQGAIPPTTGNSMASSPMTSSVGSSTPTTHDELETPERRDEIVGDIPEEKAKEPKSESAIPESVMPTRTVAQGLTSIPVGDQSLSNMNARNRAFWRR